MGILIATLFIRIFSNSYLNVFQKLLTAKGESPSIINFYTYLGLSIIGLAICPSPIFTPEILHSFFIMGLLGALGNYFIIKALSLGELSTLAPINAYKPIVALVFGILLLNEIPNLTQILGILLIIAGTLIIRNNILTYNKSTLYRTLALIFSGTEAIFIKKIIILSNVESGFLYWALGSLIFTSMFAFTSKHSFRLDKSNLRLQTGLIFLVALMQYSTNYLFSKMNVAHALALFQLSTIVSIFLGFNIFKESELLKKLIASCIMITGAAILILY